MFIDTNGNLYEGDMMVGDREATAEEIAAWELSKLPTAHDLEEIKRNLLAEGVIKRDFLLMHLRWFYTKTGEEISAAVGEAAINAAIAKRDAINAAINSLQNIFNDPRIVAAINGEVKTAADQVKQEIGVALYTASPETWLALKALDPL